MTDLSKLSDRELLELAAEAAGAEWDSKLNVYWLADSEGVSYEWHPLHDAGDALRLAVALRIRHERHLAHPFVAAFSSDVVGRFEVPEGDDPLAATCRAITIAAAAIALAKRGEQ